MENRKITTAQVAAALAITTLCSKLLGFFREQVLANFFGAGSVTDAYSMGSTISGTIFAGIIGAIATAYLPVFSKKMSAEGLESANLFTSQIVNYETLAASVISVLGIIFSDKLVWVFAPGYAGETAELTAFYLRVVFVMTAITCSKVTFQSYLEYNGVFSLNPVLGCVQNIAIISFVILGAKLGNPKLLVFGSFTGSMIFLIVNCLVSVKKGFRYTASLKFSSAAAEVVALAVPVFIGSSASQINSFIDQRLASVLPLGSVSSLHYASTLVSTVSSFTFGIFVTILYPRLAKAFAENNKGRISSISQRTLSLISVIAIPFTFGAVVYSNEAIKLVYERGAFSQDATVMTASAFLFYALAIFFNGVNGYLGRVYYSLHDTKTPVVISVAAVVLNIILNLCLIGPMGHAGLALATSISQAASTVISFIVFGKKYKDIVLFSQWKKLCLTIGLSLFAVGLSRAAFGILTNCIAGHATIIFVGCMGLAVLVYLAMLMGFKYSELSLIKDLLGKNGETQ